MNKQKVIEIIKIFIFIGLGIFLFIYALKGTNLNLEKIKNSLSHDIKYSWIILSLILGLLSHVSRAYRWSYLIETIGYKPSKANLFFSVMVMYLTNFAFPRSGEVSRCAVLKKYENMSFSKTLGTVVIERTFDMIFLIFISGIIIIFQYDIFIKFLDFESNKTVNENSNYMFLFIISSLIITAIIVLIFKQKIIKTSIYIKAKEFLRGILEGIKTIANLKKKKLFILHTLIIWVLYFTMLYVCFYSMDFSKNLSLTQGLTMFVLVSYGMVVPVPGGMGPWHIMAIHSLLIFTVADYNITEFYNNPNYLYTERENAGIWALVIHGAQTLMLISVGFISLILLPIFNKKR